MPDSRDFEAFCFQQNAALIRLLTAYCGDGETARDLTQEALARAWVHWRRVSRMERPELWVRRVAFNLANSQFRRKKVERSARERDAQTGDWLHSDPDGGQRIDIREALGRLTERQRAVVVLRFLEDLSVEQTAELMNCGNGTVKKLTARALAGLRVWLGDEVGVTRDA